MSRLPLRSRLFLALATVALLPVVLFGVVALVRVTTSASDQPRARSVSVETMRSRLAASA